MHEYNNCTASRSKGLEQKEFSVFHVQKHFNSDAMCTHHEAQWLMLLLLLLLML